jgi:hypothetical protein
VLHIIAVTIYCGSTPSNQSSMPRAYAIGQGAGTQAITQLPALLLFGPPDQLRLVLMMGGAWVINLGVAEWLIAVSAEDGLRGGSLVLRARPPLPWPTAAGHRAAGPLHDRMKATGASGLGGGGFFARAIGSLLGRGGADPITELHSAALTARAARSRDLRHLQREAENERSLMEVGGYLLHG